jgi:hypothetical protein
MAGLFAKLAFMLSCAFGVVVLLIRAQPYNDLELHNFLTPPEGCEAPCFLGIRPGISSFDEAVEILRVSPLVVALSDIHEYPNHQQSISWTWNDTQAYLSHSQPNQIFSTRGNVGTMVIYTHIPLIQIWWIFGQPDWMHHLQGGLYIFGYSRHNLVIEVGISGCNMLHVLTSPTALSFQAGVAGTEGLNANEYDTNVTLDQFRNYDRCAHPSL